MQYVQRYIELYPNDTVVLKGGAAAYILLKECLNQDIYLKDIDISINTTISAETILQRWLSIVPKTYIVEYDDKYSLSYSAIFTLVDTTNSELSLDIFVNEDHYTHLEQVGNFKVERLDCMIGRIYRDLRGRKNEIETTKDLLVPWIQKERPKLIDKYNRMYKRLELLIECYKKHKLNIPNTS